MSTLYAPSYVAHMKPPEQLSHPVQGTLPKKRAVGYRAHSIGKINGAV